MSLRSMPIATRAALSFALITALLVITGIFPEPDGFAQRSLFGHQRQLAA